MMNATKTPSGKWRVLGAKLVNGKRIRKSFTASTKKQAEMMMTEWMHRPETDDVETMTVYDLLVHYISIKENVLSPSTIATYRMNIRKSFDEIKDYDPRDLTNDIIQRWINHLAIDRTPKTAKNLYGQLMTALRFEIPSIQFQITLPKREVAMPTIPGDDEIKLLLKYAEPEMRKAICLGAFGGLRRGEICGITYGDIIREHNMIHIHRTVVRNSAGEEVIKNFPKNATSDRYVELPRSVIILLGIGEPDEPVVKYKARSITSGFDRLREKTGSTLSFHALRHYSASLMHFLGCPDVVIMDRHGWKSDGTMKRIYRNVLEDKKNDYVDKVNDYVTEHFDLNDVQVKNKRKSSRRK